MALSFRNSIRMFCLDDLKFKFNYGLLLGLKVSHNVQFLIIFRSSFNTGYVGSKPKSIGQIKEKVCSHS